MCYDSKARPPATRLQREFGYDLMDERKMLENLTYVEALARAQTDAAIKTLVEIMTDPRTPARMRNAVPQPWLKDLAIPVCATRLLQSCAITVVPT